MARTVYPSLAETIKAFRNKESEHGRNPTDTLYFQNDILYSYGTHFPLCIEIQRKEPERHYTGKMFWVNGERYSATTSKHQNKLFKEISDKNRIEIPYSAIRRIDSGGTDVIKELQVIDFQPDRWIELDEVDKYGSPRMKHVLGGALVQYRNRVFLSGIDESGAGAGLYHLTELDVSARLIPTTIEEAYEYLKPDKVKQAEADGLRMYRQGEWFFIAVDDTLNKKLDKELIVSGKVLEHRDVSRPKRHKVTEYVDLHKHQYARGTVRHIDGDHSMLRLYDKELGLIRRWYEAVENVQVTSWSIAGNVD